MPTIDRRSFLAATAAASAAAALRPAPARAAAGGNGPRKALVVSMISDKLPWPERFAVARDAGFEGVELHTVTDPKEADAIKAALAGSGITVHSIMNSDHWKYPLSSADPEVVTKSVAGMETSLRNAAFFGCDSVLLVPAVVNPETGYRDAWTRSQKVVRERILPLATELKVTVGMEEVWNKFLLSPLELARYVDELGSPYVKAYLDVGNMLFYGYPQDWIRTLGKRIWRMHLKDFKLDRSAGKFEWKNLGEGDVDWPAVRKAMADVGYTGWVTCEVQGGDAAYLKDLGARVDRFLAGQKPVA
jgi:L-ribulose-5-phosphate 3-epimerase